MLEPKLLRSKLEYVVNALSRRGYSFDKPAWTRLDGDRRKLQMRTEELQAERNTRSKKVAAAKSKGEDVSDLLKEIKNYGDALKSSQDQLEVLQGELRKFLLDIPNLPDEKVPDGSTEDDNQVVRLVGNPNQFDFKVKDHVELGSIHKGIFFDTASKLSGARFSILSGNIARLHRALISFMLTVHIKEHNYQEVYVPYLVNEESMIGTGQLPKFKDDLFSIEQQGLYLIPTAEVPVTGMFRDDIIEAMELPLAFVSHTPCFRSEAGSYGKDTRGMIRQHQFEKVELVRLSLPENSEEEHELLTTHAETILQKLQLPYRVVSLCAGDLGFSAAKTYDLEAWLPSQNCYREISSCSNFNDFQARRLRARFKDKVSGAFGLVHTLNGSGLAVGRTLIAIMENNQMKDGSIRIPDVLVSYMEGLEIIEPD